MYIFKVTYHVWADAVGSGKPFIWCGVQLFCPVSVDFTVLAKVTLWPAFEQAEFSLWRGRTLSLILVLIWGKIGYKTKGTVLVFSWCGSGFIMPQIEKEQQKQRGSSRTASEPSQQASFSRHGYKGETVYRYIKLQKQQGMRTNGRFFINMRLSKTYRFRTSNLCASKS